MPRFLIIIVLLFSAFVGNTQELNATVKVNADFVNQTNQQIFKSLERSLSDFINQTKWTDKKYTVNERIQCSFVFNITNYENDRFTASLQVQSLRPVYDASYLTSVLNFQDNNANFSYIEFQPLVYNPNAFESNLVSLVSYYVYIILGMDADTFALNSGTPYFEIAQQIVNQAQQSGFGGWSQSEGGLRNRFWLTDNLLSDTFKEFRNTHYTYHRNGLDLMVETPKQAKQNIADALQELKAMGRRRPNSFLMQLFFDAKSDEISSIFSDGPSIDIKPLLNTLNRIAPFFIDKWSNIKY